MRVVSRRRGVPRSLLLACVGGATLLALVLGTRRPSIGRLYRAGDVAGLVEAMTDASFARRLTVVAALQNLSTPAAEAALLDALSDPNSFIRSLAVGALAKIDPERDPEPILQALRGGDPSATYEPSPSEVITTGLHLLSRLDTVPILIRGLDSEDHWTRVGSAQALGTLADQRATAALAAAQSDSHKHVRQEARKAFDKTVAASG